MTEPATQMEVLEYFNENAADAASVGGYVRVVEPERNLRTCFGPKRDESELGWRVVEIGWDPKEFLMAPPAEREADD